MFFSLLFLLYHLSPDWLWWYSVYPDSIMSFYQSKKIPKCRWDFYIYFLIFEFLSYFRLIFNNMQDNNQHMLVEFIILMSTYWGPNMCWPYARSWVTHKATWMLSSQKDKPWTESGKYDVLEEGFSNFSLRIPLYS